MKILIDADGCPVVHEAVELAQKYKVECIILCDYAHEIQSPYAKTMVYDTGADSVDFALVNQVNQHDIIVTQDYGLAAMALSKGGLPINQNGELYTHDNIDYLLHQREVNRKIRANKGRVKGPKKRNKEQDSSFQSALEALLNQVTAD